jgi:methionine sulfoxide reductase heme-binding subunit
MLDACNKLSHHLIIGFLSLVGVIIIGLTPAGFNRSVAAIPFFLLFFTMLIGPAIRVWPRLRKVFPGELPWALRGELGIWFVVWSIIHILFVFNRRNWAVVDYVLNMSPWAFGAFVATFLGIVLAVTSSRKAINFLGFEAWKWLQSFAYVIFWLTAVHVIDRALLRPGFPSSDWLHWTYLLMFVLIVLLHVFDFVKKATLYRKQSKVN